MSGTDRKEIAELQESRNIERSAESFFYKGDDVFCREEGIGSRETMQYAMRRVIYKARTKYAEEAREGFALAEIQETADDEKFATRELEDDREMTIKPNKVVDEYSDRYAEQNTT